MRVLMSFILLSVLLISCGRPSIYKSVHLKNTIQSHKSVAILPANVRMKMRAGSAKRNSLEALNELSEKTGRDVQSRMYSWLLKRSKKRTYSVAIQNIGQTNRLLEKAGIAYADIDATNATKIADILGVDGIIQTDIVTEKPISTGTAIALILLDDKYWTTTTNVVETTINVKDGRSGKALWRYDYTADGAIGSSTKKLVNRLMRNVSKRFPYASKR